MDNENTPQTDEAPAQQHGGETFEPNNAFELLDVVAASDHVAHAPDSVLG
ncbi:MULTISPECIES: hypothetical protein [Streptomyces]|uniref:Uncharacterized protein n=1 Tax=Streptomyces ramulosus TaxID=47762 RepID=A0ABW1FG67_9ACTN